MAVSVIGTQNLNPFKRGGVADPIGQLIGVASVVGTVSGGFQTITYNLDESFAHLVQAIAGLTDAGATQTISIRYNPGALVAGSPEEYGINEAVPTDGAEEILTYIPPRILALEQADQAQIQIRIANVDTRVLLGYFRALVWDRSVFARIAPAEFVGFLT